MVLDCCPVPVGTVPIYEAAVKARFSYGGVLKMKEEDLFTVIEEHAAEGVDFITVHCGLTMAALNCLRSEGRIMGLVSRGGAILAGWMWKMKGEPLYEILTGCWDRCEASVTLSLGTE